MWFLLSLLALSILVSKRSAEKKASRHIDSLALAWLQQAVALPFIVGTLFFARFYWPQELSGHFWVLMLLYAALISLETYLYFKALSLADISYVAPLIKLVALGTIAGAYIVLDQLPNFFGLFGAILIVVGAGITYHAKRHDLLNRDTNKLALLVVLILVVIRGFDSNIEVLMLRRSNPTTFNFYSSIISAPLILLASLMIINSSRSAKYSNYWGKVKHDFLKHQWLLVFIGLTYTLSMLATYQAKLISPNAGYVTAIKSASVLPMMLVGLIFFKEKIIGKQWLGLGFIAAGLVSLAFG